MKTSLRALGMCAPALLAGAAPALAQYDVGSEWNRFTDWVDGTVQNDTFNNPGTDWAGNPVWSYEWTRGDALGSDHPWFAQSTERLVWDDDWWGHGYGAWTRGDDVNPPVLQNRLTHNLWRAVADAIPVVRWLNPVGDGSEFTVEGNLTVKWSGIEQMGSETDVDVVISMFDASLGSITPLLAETVSKPTPGDSVGDTLAVPVLLESVLLDAGDSLLITHRGQGTFTADKGRWIPMYDNLTITLVPAPGSLALLGLGGLLAVRRRR